MLCRSILLSMVRGASVLTLLGAPWGCGGIQSGDHVASTPLGAPNAEVRMAEVNQKARDGGDSSACTNLAVQLLSPGGRDRHVIDGWEGIGLARRGGAGRRPSTGRGPAAPTTSSAGSARQRT
jgi:hypothetical protein